MDTVRDFAEFKAQGRKISIVTAYDTWSARIVGRSGVDAILVGDSLSMVMHGHPTTLSATVRLMTLHTEAVARAGSGKFLIADMPFLSFRRGLTSAMKAVGALMRAGAQAVKLEGVDGHEDVVRHIVGSGVPVMGHIGLTPQSVHQLGGYRVQGRSDPQAESLRRQARTLEELGCFAIVLECVPDRLAAQITAAAAIPTIGIGAGNATDGQVLVLQDLWGINQGAAPRFVRSYVDGDCLLRQALDRYDTDVKEGQFPGPQETYLMTTFEDFTEWRKERRRQARAGITLGMVPTMGALHEGHVSLVRRSRDQNDGTLVSIFVNPTQFDDPADLAAYPRALQDDLALLESEGVDFVWVPKASDLYPDSYRYRVIEIEQSRELEGAFRPGHFDAVLTIVLKLLQIAAPDRAYFGEKDWQQLRLVQGMADAFFLPTTIVACPTVRETSGLALSSRNRRLSETDRQKAPELHRVLTLAPTAADARRDLSADGFSVDYVEDHDTRRLAAVRLGGVRLIDNVPLGHR